VCLYLYTCIWMGAIILFDVVIGSEPLLDFVWRFGSYGFEKECDG